MDKRLISLLFGSLGVIWLTGVAIKMHRMSDSQNEGREPKVYFRYDGENTEELMGEILNKNCYKPMDVTGSSTYDKIINCAGGIEVSKRTNPFNHKAKIYNVIYKDTDRIIIILEMTCWIDSEMSCPYLVQLENVISKSNGYKFNSQEEEIAFLTKTKN